MLEETELNKDLTMEKPYTTFEQEFNNLPRGQQSAWAAAARNPDLNRVSHLVAYDFNRVHIQHSPLGDYPLCCIPYLYHTLPIPEVFLHQENNH